MSILSMATYNAVKMISILKKVHETVASKLYSENLSTIRHASNYIEARDDFAVLINNKLRKSIRYALDDDIVHISSLYVLDENITEENRRDFRSLDDEKELLPTWCKKKGYLMYSTIYSNVDDVVLLTISLIPLHILN